MRSVVKVPGYHIEELLSWGSQGDVFRGINQKGQMVAMKIVTGDRADGDPQASERLRREARLLAAIDSPHIVKVLEFQQCPEWSCLVLEFLAGQRLDAAVRARAGSPAEPAGTSPSQATVQLSTSTAVRTARSARAAATPATPAAMQTREHVAWSLDIALQLARGSAEMHRIRLVHRDLKPQNVMLVGDRVVLIDFGFARRDGVTTMTQTGTAIGTLAYMSPELLSGESANERLDVYALGATIYHCLTGAPPFGSTEPTLKAMAGRGRPRSARSANPAVDVGLAAVVARCLEPDPRDRYLDAEAVLMDLERVQRGERVRIPFSLGRLWRHRRRRCLQVAGLAAALLLASWVFSGFQANSVASTILRELAAKRPTTARDAWQACDEEGRLQVTAALNHRLADDGTLAIDVATTLGLGLLRLEPRPKHWVALAPSNGMDAAPSLPHEAFFATDTPCNLLVRPGRAWFFVMASEPQHRWSAEDPFCLQLLLHFEVANSTVAPRSLIALRTQPIDRIEMEPVGFAAGPHAIRDIQKRVVMEHLATPFVAGAQEVSVALVHDFRRTLAAQVRHRADLDAWLGHPDEPKAATELLWRTWLGTKGSSVDQQPARINFWEAHRFAAWNAFRLPSLIEWQVIACDPERLLGTNTQRVIHGDTLEAVGALTWDRTSRGIRHATSNAREWVLERRDDRDKTQFLAAPVRTRMEGPTMLAWHAALGGGESPDHHHGLRLYRTLQPSIPR